jgi:hypothetical protein
MSRLLYAALFLFGLTGVAAANLVANGDFEQPLDVGWTDTVVGYVGEGRFERADTFGQPVSGYAAKVWKTLADYASLFQVVDIPDANVNLTFDARFSIGGGSSTCWPVAVFMVRYLDDAGNHLGKTRYYLHDQYCTWEQRDTSSLIEITNPDHWASYQLSVRDELQNNLTGINPDAVRKLCIELFAYDNGT